MAATAGAALSQLLLALFFLLLAGTSHGAVLGVQTGTATWSGPPDSARYDNQSLCGFGEAVLNAPFHLFVTGFGNSSDCGVCYKVTCKEHPACSPNGVTVTVTDDCRGPPELCNPEKSPPTHFDMGGYAFGDMALPGREDELRAAVSFEWIDCYYSRPNASVVYPAFQPAWDSTIERFILRLIYVEYSSFWPGVKVSLKNAGDTEWREMKHHWAADWGFTDDDQNFLTVTPPLSIRVQTTNVGAKDNSTEAE